MRIGILTISDRAAQGAYEDKSGQLIHEIIDKRTSWHVVQKSIIPDEQGQIARLLIAWCEDEIDLVLTTGGTGFGPRDVTPEATRQIIEREAPGLSEAVRYEGLKITPHAMLSRATAGIRGKTLIINLPGNPKAVKEGLDVLLPVLPHALDILAEQPQADAGHRIV